MRKDWPCLACGLGMQRLCLEFATLGGQITASGYGMSTWETKLMLTQSTAAVVTAMLVLSGSPRNPAREIQLALSPKSFTET